MQTTAMYRNDREASLYGFGGSAPAAKELKRKASSGFSLRAFALLLGMVAIVAIEIIKHI
jgi:hypothetical protein